MSSTLWPKRHLRILWTKYMKNRATHVIFFEELSYALYEIKNARNVNFEVFWFHNRCFFFHFEIFPKIGRFCANFWTTWNKTFFSKTFCSKLINELEVPLGFYASQQRIRIFLLWLFKCTVDELYNFGCGSLKLTQYTLFWGNSIIICFTCGFLKLSQTCPDSHNAESWTSRKNILDKWVSLRR